MKSLIACLTISIITASSSLAETVTTTDGRTITLNEDGTYVVEENTIAASIAYLEELEYFFERHVSQYQQESIRFIPKFRNVSDKAIAGIRFTSSFRDAFGEEIFSFNGDVTELVSPGASSTSNVFYVFENNPFINGEPYDKLLPMITGGTGTVSTSVTGIAMGTGEVVSFR